jgi:raffinose/stachyose/melibiose transport system permease protein
MGKFRKKSLKSKIAFIIKYLFLIAGAFLSLYPFIWVLLSSFKDNNDIYSNSFGLPKIVQWNNYVEAWNSARVGISFFNSLLVSLGSIIILILITAMGSYILTRVHKSAFLSIYLSLGIMIPIHAMLIPSVIIFKHLNLQDNLVSLVLMYIATNISFSLFIMKGFMDKIPRELDEAATIDGCGQTGIFFRIIFPMAKPGIATVATLAFLNCWNDLLLGLVLISDPAKRTLSMSISALKGSYVTQYGLLCSGFVISIVPVVIMYLLFQKQVVQGMTAGAVKG